MIPSTIASDGLLALACMFAALWCLRHADPRRRYAALGFVLMAAAALLGCGRFAGVEAMVPAHRFTSRLAGAIAPGCFALVGLAVARAWARRVVELGLVGLSGAWALFELGLGLGVYRTGIGTLAVLVMIVVGGWARARAGLSLIAGALTLALAGLVIGSEGTIGPLLAVDVFHAALAVAHLLIAAGLVGLEGPGPSPQSSR